MTMPDHPSEQPITKALHNMKPTHGSEHEIYGWGIRSPTFTGSRSILLAISRAKGSLILSTSLGRKEGKPFTETLLLTLGIAALVVDVTRSDGIPNSDSTVLLMSTQMGEKGGKYRREREIAACRSTIYLISGRLCIHKYATVHINISQALLCIWLPWHHTVIFTVSEKNLPNYLDFFCHIIFLNSSWFSTVEYLDS